MTTNAKRVMSEGMNFIVYCRISTEIDHPNNQRPEQNVEN